jgi:hypothetical protein
MYYTFIFICLVTFEFGTNDMGQNIILLTILPIAFKIKGIWHNANLYLYGSWEFNFGQMIWDKV